MSVDAHLLEHRGGQVRLLSGRLVPIDTERHLEGPEPIGEAQGAQVVRGYVVDRLQGILDGLLSHGAEKGEREL